MHQFPQRQSKVLVSLLIVLLSFMHQILLESLQHEIKNQHMSKPSSTPVSGLRERPYQGRDH